MQAVPKLPLRIPLQAESMGCRKKRKSFSLICSAIHLQSGHSYGLGGCRRYILQKLLNRKERGARQALILESMKKKAAECLQKTGQGIEQRLFRELQKQWPSSGLVSANEQRQNLRAKFQGFHSACFITGSVTARLHSTVAGMEAIFVFSKVIWPTASSSETARCLSAS